jgi:hypothetical protein
VAGVFTKNMSSLMNVLLCDWYTQYTGMSFSYTDWEGTEKTITGNIDTTRESCEYTAKAFDTMTTRTVPATPRGWDYSTGIAFLSYGSGTTDPTTDDYTLTDYIDNLTCSSGTCGKTANGKQYTQVVTNETNEDITITELGLFVLVHVNYSQPSAMKSSVMLYHEVLDTPITLEPGQTATFTAELTFV